MYLALYRKFRPKSFDKIVGQGHITKTLINQIETKQIGHAYLFCGSRGTGKTTAAKVFARAINCLTPENGSPCGKCEVCQNLEKTQNIDIIEIDAASNNRVDEIRDLREKIKYPPVYGKYKVYIIDEVHMLTDSAFNALLKTLEEPPVHAVFILATTEPHKLPATILSRVLRFDFKLVGQNDLCMHLKNVFDLAGIKAEPEAISLIAKAGQGSVRDMLSIADMCASFANNDISYKQVLEVLGQSNFESLQKMAQSIFNSDVAGFVSELSNQANSGKNLLTLSSDLTKYFRDLLVLKACGESGNFVDLPLDEKQTMHKMAENLSDEQLNTALQAFSKIESELKYSINPLLLIEATAISVMCDIKKKTNLKQNASATLVNTTVKISDEKPQQQHTFAEKPANARQVWGKVLVQMRKDNLVTLKAMCSEITDVEILDGKFYLRVSNKTDYDLLNNSFNYSELVACFNKLGYTYNIVVEKINNNTQNEKSKAEILKDLLGVNLLIIK